MHDPAYSLQIHIKVQEGQRDSGQLKFQIRGYVQLLTFEVVFHWK